jgi:hypothetical protein
MLSPRQVQDLYCRIVYTVSCLLYVRLIGSVKTDRATKSKFGSPNSGGLAKNLYSKLEGLTVSCSGTWAWSERVNVCIQQIMILLQKTNMCERIWVPGSLVDHRAPVIVSSSPFSWAVKMERRLK